MSGIVFIAYDVETASDSTGGFLAGARELHREFGVPWTVFFTGKTIAERTADCLRVAGDPLVTLAQHTYNHVLLKSVHLEPNDGKPCREGGKATFFKEGGSLEQIADEISRTQEVFQKTFGRPCRGLTGPWGYYRGLRDRPDILRIVDRAGLRWLRTDARDYRDCQPVPLELQPYFYADQGCPEILECPMQGYQDDFYWERFDDRAHGPRCEDYLLWAMAQAARCGRVFTINSHDHGTPTAQAFHATKGRWLRAVLDRGRQLDVKFMGYEEYYRQRLVPKP
jgi:peptidoglycan/xylan/chitin deacetylase (PgdA/CDA1 family)